MTVARPFVRALLRSPPNSSKGAALLVILFLVLAAFSTVIVSQLSKANLEAQKQKKTQEALAQAKQALIAWSVLQGDIGNDTYNRQRPGTLPCPATDDLGSVGSTCKLASSSTIGRLPWKELGIDVLRDADGETLWYAMDENFRRPGLSNTPINSDSKGSLMLSATDGATSLTPSGEELVAIIFSAGSPLSGQDRSSTTSPANYLDSAKDANNVSWNNAAAGGPFITGPVRDAQGNVTINDIAIGISAKELMAAVEKRALKEAQLLLTAYYDANGKYPNPAKATVTTCKSTRSSISNTATCDSDPSTCFGRFPEDISVSSYPATWFQQNAWGRVMTYALSDSGAGCSNTLTVDGTAKSYVLVAPGTARSGQTRPSASLADYLEDSANTDAWAANPNFATPSTVSNDQLRSAP